MVKKILLKRSKDKETDGKPKLPSASQVSYGELTMNYAEGVETLAIKNSSDNIVTFSNEVNVGTQTPANSSMAKIFINESDSSVQYHSSEGWKPLETGGGGDSGTVNVTQTTGTSTTLVMSQNAVTTELNKKANTNHTHTASQVTGLSSVATSGSYDDLSNKPTIPPAYTLPIASPTQLGGVRVGDGLEIDDSGVLNCTIDPGSGTVSWGNISGKPTFAKVATTGSYNDLTDKPTIPSQYVLPIASSSTLGGIKVGSGLSIAVDGTLSASGGGVADSVAWDNITGKPSTFTPSEHTHDVATDSTNGFMSADDKEKLDNIHENATQVTFTQTMSSGTPIGTININGTPTTLYAPTAGEPVTYGNATASAVGLVKLGSDTVQNTTANVVTHTASRTYAVQNNSNGQMVVNVPWTDTTYSTATSSLTGLMSASDKAKLDSIAEGATKITVDTELSTTSINPVQNKVIFAALGNDVNFATTINNKIDSKVNKSELTNYVTKTELNEAVVEVDSALSSTSTNPVQNKVINSALAGKANTSHTHTASQVSGLSTVATTGSYNDLTDKPTIPSAYTLPQSTSSALGGIKIGYSENNKNYPVELNASGQAYVNVPWINTTYSIATTSLSGLMSSTDKSRMDSLYSSAFTGFSSTSGDGNVVLDDRSGSCTIRFKSLSNDKVAECTIPAATSDSPGLMSSSDKTKLDSLSNSGVVVNSVTLGTRTANTAPITVSKTDGSSSSLSFPVASAEFAGLMSASDKDALLSGVYYVRRKSLDATSFTFEALRNQGGGLDTTIPAATTTTAGLLTASDKVKLNGIDSANIAYVNKSNSWSAYQDFTSGAGNSGSDMRFKENVQPVKDVLDQVLGIDVISYTWNKEGEAKRDTFGVNADALKNMGGIFSKMVHERDDETKTKWVEYDRIGVLVLEAFKEYVAKTEQKIKDLEEKLQSIKN